MLAQACARCPALRLSVTPDDDWSTFQAAAERTAESALATREAELQFDDPINIQYTSGTTGFPKGACLSHHNVLNNGFFVGETMCLTHEDRVCVPVPFYHCFGMVLGNLACTTHGACIVVPGVAYDPSACFEAVAAEKCTASMGSRPCSSASSTTHHFCSPNSTFRPSEPGSWPWSPCPIEG